MVLAEHSDSYLRSERSIVSLRFGQGKTHAFLKLFLGSLSDVGSFQPPKSIKPAPNRPVCASNDSAKRRKLAGGEMTNFGVS